MGTVHHDDRFLVFLRCDTGNKNWGDSGEQPLASCATYEEARQIRKALLRSATGECVIRFVGPTGGGD